MSLNLQRGSLLWILLATSVVPVSLVTLLTAQQGAWHVPLIVVALVLLVPLLAVRFIAYPMGWFWLARSFPFPRDARPAWADTLTTMGLRKPWLGLNNCIAWASDGDALCLMFDRPFGWGMPRVRIPWEAIDEIKPANGLAPDKAQAFELVASAARPLPVRVFVARDLVARELSIRQEAAQDLPTPANAPDAP
jgi:hypothetical protein